MACTRPDLSALTRADGSDISRQTIFLAFGNRAGLLTAMARNQDRQSDHVRRLGEISFADSASPGDLRRYLEIWLDYLAIIYPVAILLDAAALTDAEAAAALDDRMKGALLAGFKRIFGLLQQGGHLRPAWSAERAAELAWGLVHPASWRQLVVACAWSPDEVRRSRLEIIRRTLIGGRDEEA